MKEKIIILTALFVPLRIRGRWTYTFMIAGIPIGMIMIAVSVIVNLLMR